VAAISGQFALQKMHAKMLADPVGRIILAEKPRVSEQAVDLPALRKLPSDSFGRAYANYVDNHGCVCLC
jgi:ubiquinone biosynthesis protein COQ4